MPSRRGVAVYGERPEVLPEELRLEQSRTMKLTRVQLLELPSELWEARPSNGKPTKPPSSKQHRLLLRNSSKRKHRPRPTINRASTPSNAHFQLAWTLADIPLSKFASRSQPRETAHRKIWIAAKVMSYLRTL